MEESRQLLHKVHMKLHALKAPPSDTGQGALVRLGLATLGAAAAAEGNAAKQARALAAKL